MVEGRWREDGTEYSLVAPSDLAAASLGVTGAKGLGELQGHRAELGQAEDRQPRAGPQPPSMVESDQPLL